jgi:uncharacterized protein
VIDIEMIKHEILERLKPLDLDRIILFGSYAYGTPTEDSDIDLYVVTKDDFIPQSWKEKSSLNKKISSVLRDLRRTHAIDLIVHTKAMNDKFRILNSSFSRELLVKGEVLL